jgi:PfaD family protein
LASQFDSLGTWQSRDKQPAFGGDDLIAMAQRMREPAYVVQDPSSRAIGVALGGEAQLQGSGDWPLLAVLPPLYPEWLGCRSFCEAHGIRFPYVSGAMANGIATTELVIAMAKAGFLGFFGAAGLSLERVTAAVDELQNTLGSSLPWGSNLIHSPHEPALEEAVAELYIRRGVERVSAAAYMALTPAIVRLALSGVSQAADGSIQRKRYVFAKISRPEVARRFLEPAPQRILDDLLARGLLSAEEIRLGASLPVAEDLIVESDSGGHTDNRPLSALLPCILSLRDEVVAERRYARPVRVGAAGGMGTPAAVAAAFTSGAAFVLTGSVNQACTESGLDASGRAMLAKASIADVTMAPAADMFEMGVEVQVLSRGTMFAMRARKLLELYRAYPSLEAIPADEASKVEKQMLRCSFAQAWASTQEFWQGRDPGEVRKAEADPKHLMALVFRSYLGQSSRWAIAGEMSRTTDFQIWCGPAMGAFNNWSAGSFLAEPEQRQAVQVARNLMEGAAAITRAQQLRSAGVAMPAASFDFKPRLLS